MTGITTNHNTKSNSRILTKKDGRHYLEEWKMGFRSKCDKVKLDDGYALTDQPSKHLNTSIPRPIQTDYQTAQGADKIPAYGKQLRFWIQMESQASDVMMRHLDDELKAIFVNAANNATTFKGYSAVLRSLLLNDIILGLELSRRLDCINQKPNESAVAYLARIKESEMI
jgi:hypothetical protein